MSRRIQREYENLTKDPSPYVKRLSIIDTDGEGNTSWKLVIESPEESSYLGKGFAVFIIFPPDYPYSAPTIRFDTKIFHPNISYKGDVCVEALGFGKWTVSSTIRMVISSIRNLLLEPDMSNPLNPEAALEMSKGKEVYNATVKRWLETYNKSL